MDDSDGFSCKGYENDLHEENGGQNGQKVSRLHNVLKDVESIIEDSGVDEVKDLEHNKSVKDVSHVDRVLSSFGELVSVDFEAIHYYF